VGGVLAVIENQGLSWEDASRSREAKQPKLSLGSTSKTEWEVQKVSRANREVIGGSGTMGEVVEWAERCKVRGHGLIGIHQK